MFNPTGTAYAADRPSRARQADTVPKRFVLWFNGNGIPERYWIPSPTGADYDITPCLTPIGRLKDDVLVLSGLDNTYGGDGHPQSLCALMTCTRLDSDRARRPVARPDSGRARSAATRVSARCRSAFRRSRSAARCRRT